MNEQAIPLVLLGQAVQRLRRGELVAIPTETVYGLAADARNVAALARVFEAKGRPAEHPLIAHLASAADLAQVAREIPAAARRLAARFWPGPLTLVLPRHPSLPPELTGGQDTVAVRVPAHPVARHLLHAFGGPLAAPSANRFGRLSPTSAAHVRAEFGDAFPVLDGGPCSLGIESTIVDLSGRAPRLLRPGAIAAGDLAECLGEAPGPPESDAPRVPGALARHYAPATRTRLCGSDLVDGDLEGVALLLCTAAAPAGVETRRLPPDPTGYARGLYAALRELDARGAREIRIERPPEGEAWDAIHDRLRRAVAA